MASSRQWTQRGPQGQRGIGMAALLLAGGAAMLGIAFVLWRDGSDWGLLIAWFLAMYGCLVIGWGLIAGWWNSALACLAGAAFAAASVVIALGWIHVVWLTAAVLCAIGGLLTAAVGALRVRELLRG
jgi:hypothetical protein